MSDDDIQHAAMKSTKDHEELLYAAPRTRVGFYRSVISLCCTVSALGVVPILYAMRGPSLDFLLFSIIISVFGLLFMLGLGYAILALVKEKPKKWAAIAFLAAGSLMASMFIFGQWVSRM